MTMTRMSQWTSLCSTAKNLIRSSTQPIRLNIPGSRQSWILTSWWWSCWWWWQVVGVGRDSALLDAWAANLSKRCQTFPPSSALACPLLSRTPFHHSLNNHHVITLFKLFEGLLHLDTVCRGKAQLSCPHCPTEYKGDCVDRSSSRSSELQRIASLN